MQPENLISVKDDMVAFIEGHGMRRFPGFVGEDVSTIQWEDETNPDSWKDFVEMAKAASAAFLTMSEATLEKEDLELLIEGLHEADFATGETPELDEVQYLVNYVGKLGYLQLSFAYQGVVYLHETSTQWYEQYQHLLESVEAFGDILLGGEGDDDEES